MTAVAVRIRQHDKHGIIMWKCMCYTCPWKTRPSDLSRTLKKAHNHVNKCVSPYNGWVYECGSTHEYWVIGFW